MLRPTRVTRRTVFGSILLPCPAPITTKPHCGSTDRTGYSSPFLARAARYSACSFWRLASSEACSARLLEATSVALLIWSISSWSFLLEASKDSIFSWISCTLETPKSCNLLFNSSICLLILDKSAFNCTSSSFNSASLESCSSRCCVTEALLEIRLRFSSAAKPRFLIMSLRKLVQVRISLSKVLRYEIISLKSWYWPLIPKRPLRPENQAPAPAARINKTTKTVFIVYVCESVWSVLNRKNARDEQIQRRLRLQHVRRRLPYLVE